MFVGIFFVLEYRTVRKLNNRFILRAVYITCNKVPLFRWHYVWGFESIPSIFQRHCPIKIQTISITLYRPILMMQAFKVNKCSRTIIKSRQTVMNSYWDTDLWLLKYNLIYDITFSLMTTFKYIVLLYFMRNTCKFHGRRTH